MNVVALFLLFNKLVIVHVLKFLSFICVCAKVVVVRVYILFEDVQLNCGHVINTVFLHCCCISIGQAEIKKAVSSDYPPPIF